ncbi:GT2 family glycosyltransferase [Algoriphagus aquaeductus]|uniref:GT2 family glycosyltransferase n=1 Tax=Algoriphagus aquaeductus TaxID=475299 RepID=A0A326RM76_9BACT|nr:glycosyltransferase [Algoriphagus aquaeductus]PZV76707.1 GT2 family glycosyltransferase [Algoriphagus aquaeductus]
MPKISIIIPCFNSEKFLNETLDCLSKQSFQDWECLIVNNGSTDGTLQIAENYSKKDQRFKVLSKDHGGISSGRNLGILSAKGDFIQLLDSDDMITPNKLKNEVEFLLKHPEVDIVYSGARYFYSNDSTRTLHIYSDSSLTGTIEIDFSDKLVLEAILKRNPFVTSAPLYRSSVFYEIGLYDESLQYIEDWDFQIRCAISGKIFHYLGYKPDQSTLIRLHDRNISKNRKAVQEAKAKLMKKYPDLFPTKKKSGLIELLRLFIPPVFLKLIR